MAAPAGFVGGGDLIAKGDQFPGSTHPSTASRTVDHIWPFGGEGMSRPAKVLGRYQSYRFNTTAVARRRDPVRRMGMIPNVPGDPGGLLRLAWPRMGERLVLRSRALVGRGLALPALYFAAALSRSRGVGDPAPGSRMGDEARPPRRWAEASARGDGWGVDLLLVMSGAAGGDGRNFAPLRALRPASRWSGGTDALQRAPPLPVRDGGGVGALPAPVHAPGGRA